MIFRAPLNDIDYSRRRLDIIMGRRRLGFNPYTVTDERLMEIVDTTDWGNENDIVQIVKVHFTRLRQVTDSRQFDGIYMQVGHPPAEAFLHTNIFKHGIVANDTLHREYTYAGSRRIRKEEDIEWLVGKTFFISRVIRGCDIKGYPRVAYRLHRLYGDTARDAAIVRTAMCRAKIEMLERIRDYPECRDYLDCNRNVFDFYWMRINQALEFVKHFPDTQIPTN